MPTIALGAAAALLAFSALCVLAVPQVVHAQAARAARIAPIVGDAGDDSGLATLAPIIPAMSRWEGREIVRTYYAGESTSVEVPGLTRVPRPGHFVASPALVRALRSSAVVADLLDGLVLDGSIHDEGLVQPAELRAVIGIEPGRRTLLVPVRGFGGSQSDALVTSNRPLTFSVAVLALLLVGLPLISFAVVASRLGSRRRRSRTTALRLLGMSRQGVRVMNGAVTGIAVLPGSCLGAVSYLYVAAHVSRVPGTSWGFFARDVALGPLVVAATVMTISLLVSASTSLDAEAADGLRRAGTKVRGRRAARVGRWLLAGGLAYLGLVPLLVATLDPRAALGAWFGCGAVAVGLALSGPWLVDVTARWLAARVRNPADLVGLRLVVASGTGKRLGSLAAIVLVTLVGSQSFTSILGGGVSYPSWRAVLAERPHVPVVATDMLGRLSRIEMQRLTTGGVGGIESATSSNQPVDVLVASCEDLRLLLARLPRGCSGSEQWINRRSPGAAPRDVELHGRSVAVPGPGDVVRVQGLPEGLDGGLLLPPTYAARGEAENGIDYLFMTRGRDLTRTMARVSAHAPLVQFDLGQLEGQDPDHRPFPTQLQGLLLAAVMSLLISCLALGLVALGDGRERAERLRPLGALGAPPGVAGRAHIVAVVTAPLVLGLVGILLGWVVARAIRAFDDRAVVPLASVWLLVSGLVLAVVALALATLPGALRRYARPERGFRRR